MLKHSLLIYLLLVHIPIALSGWEKNAGKVNQNWIRFRGPNGQGQAYSNSLPAKWMEKDFNWKVKLPGRGHSSPVIWQDKIFVTSADEDLNKGYILGFNVKNGENLWQKETQITPYDIHKDNHLASPTPAVDQDHVYTIWYGQQTTFLLALDHQGREIWRSRFDGTYSRHGAASSPIVYGDFVVFTREQEGESPYRSSWVAVHRKSGNVRWELERDTAHRFSTSTPCLYNTDKDNPQLLFTSRAHGFTIVELNTGEVVWEKDSVFDHRVVTSPVISEDMLIGTCKRKLVALKLDRKADKPEAHLAYELPPKLSPYVPTPIVKDHLLFICSDNGNIACLELSTGEVIWREKPAGAFYASPVLVDERLFCVTKKGEVVVISASDKYELLAINQLEEESFATPAVAGGRMYIRTFSRLFSIGNQEIQ